MNKDAGFRKVRGHGHSEDHIALYAIANGFDGWRDSNYGYYMLVNRGVLSVSSTIKKAKNQTSGRSNISWGISPTA